MDSCNSLIVKKKNEFFYQKSVDKLKKVLYYIHHNVEKQFELVKSSYKLSCQGLLDNYKK